MIHILQIPRAYPNKFNPRSSIFFKDQAECIAENSNFKVHVLSVVMVPLKDLLKSINLIFKVFIVSNNNVLLTQVNIPTFPKLIILTIFWRFFIGKKIFKYYIRHNGIPDLIHLQTYEMGLLAIWIKKKYNIPYIVTEHFSKFNFNMSRWQVKYARKVFYYSKHNIAVSEDLKANLVNKFNCEFTYIPNVVDTEFFKNKNRKQNNRFTYINIANCLKIKQQALLINAFKNFSDKVQNVQLIIGGDGPERNKLEKQVKELELEDKVFFKGALSRNDVKYWLHQSDAFILTSQLETFGIVLIEAMSMGLPVISTKSGGPNSIIKGRDYGILCESNQQSIVNSMELIKNKKYDPNIIRNFVIENFSKASFQRHINQIIVESII